MPRSPQVREHVRRLGPDAVARPDHARGRRRRARPAAPSARPRRAGRAPRSPPAGPATPCSSSSRRVPTTTAAPPTVAVTPPPGWAWNSSAGVQRAGRVRGLGEDQPAPAGVRSAARRPRRARSRSSAVAPPSGTHVAEFELPSVSVPVLSNANAVDAGEPLQGRAALDEHAGAGEPAEGRDDGRRAWPGSARTGRPPPAPPAPGTRQPRPRRASGRAPARRAATGTARSPTNVSAARASTAGRK